MRKPRQRNVVRPAARLPGHWTPSPTPSPDLEPTGRLVMRSGSKFFSEEEEELLVKLHALLGNRWSLIAGRLPGRTGKEVESHWNSKMRRELRRMGADDPGNHRSMTTLLAPTPDDEQQRPRRRPLHLLREAECPAKHPGRRRCLSSNDEIAGDCVSDAGSYCREQQELAYGLNLELTLSTPCLYSGEREQVIDP